MSNGGNGSPGNGHLSSRRDTDAGSSKRHLVEPEVIALNELLDTFPTEMDDTQEGEPTKRRKLRTGNNTSYHRYKPRHEREGIEINDSRLVSKTHLEEDTDEEEDDHKSMAAMRTNSSVSGRHTKLTDLEQRVRALERDNLHLKQALLLGKNAAGRSAAGASVSLGALGSLAGLRAIGAVAAPGVENRANVQCLLAERTKVVTDMVEQLNAAYLSLGEASRVWHEDCRIGVGVHEWNAFGRLQTISLWNMIRSVFTSIVVDIVELRPHLPDGEMILTKWRIQGEIASAQHLESVCASEDCPPTMRVALMAIKSTDITFTVTAYVVFQELRIAEQHHSWDQVGVFKRLFGGEIPPSVHDMLVIDEDTAAGRKQPLEEP